MGQKALAQSKGITYHIVQTWDAMKFRYLLLLAAAALIVQPVPTINALAQITSQSRTSEGVGNDIYRQVNPAVVTVFAGREIGSGSIVSPQGLVITNYHVVRDSSRQIFVRTADGTRIPGQVIASDRRYDLALIQLTTSSSLPSVKIARSGIQPGQPVFAIGSPYGKPGVMTIGTFTMARGNGDLQSRVVLKPGNSGGPLLNSQGEMVGVNKGVLESARGGDTGISVATSAQITRQFIARNSHGSGAIAPSDNFQSQAPDCCTLPNPDDRDTFESFNPPSDYSMPVAPPESFAFSPFSQAAPGGFAGESQALPAGVKLGVIVDERTLEIQQVTTGSVGARSGLQVGDRLVGVNGSNLHSFDDLVLFLSHSPTSAEFMINRDGRSKQVAIRF